MRLTVFKAGLFVAAITFVAAGLTVYAQTETKTNDNQAQVAAATVEAPEPEQDKTTEAVTVVPAPVIVTVQKGDSLSKIAKAHNATYQRLFDANPSVADPSIIHPGDQIRIPAADEQLATRPTPATVATTASAKAVKPAPKKQSTTKKTVKATSATPSTPSDGSVWDRVAQCESGGNWSINTGNGYYGGLQFSLSSWKAVGGSGYPHQASKSEQIARGEMLKARQGWGAWPACTTKLGLR